MFRILWHSLGSLLLLLLISCSACKKPEDDIKHVNLTSYTEEDQLAFGNNLYQILQKYPEDFPILAKIENAEIYGYLNSLYYTLTHTNLIENRSLFNWDVTIIADDSREMAFVAPGGRLYIYTGILKYLKGEHELASLIAHELYYADAGLGIEKLQESFSGDPFLLGDIYLGYDEPKAIDVIESLRDQTYDEATVSDADRFALQNICPFTYNAIGLKQLLERAMSQGGIHWSSTRPVNDSRLQLLNSDAINCSNIEEDPTYAERYFSFTDKLP